MTIKDTRDATHSNAHNFHDRFIQTTSIDDEVTINPSHNHAAKIAPRNHEGEPMYEEANLAIDHNQLLMDIMERIAKKHSLKVEGIV